MISTTTTTTTTNESHHYGWFYIHSSKQTWMWIKKIMIIKVNSLYECFVYMWKF